MEIRLLTPEDDRMAVSRVYEKAWPFAYAGLIPDAVLSTLPQGHWAEVIDSPGWRSLLLIDAGEIVGTVAVAPARFEAYADCGEIIALYLLPPYIGRGHGRRLLQQACALLKEMGYGRVFLWTFAENGTARRFYEKNGFALGKATLTVEIGGKALEEVSYLRDLKDI